LVGGFLDDRHLSAKLTRKALGILLNCTIILSSLHSIIHVTCGS